MVAWSDIEGGGGATLKWSDIEPQDQSPGYVAQTVSNIPESAAAVGHAMIHPEDEIQGIYGLGQKIKKRLDEAAQGNPISVSHEAGRLASHLYNSIVGLPGSFKQDPVGTAVSAGLLAVGGPEAGLARAAKVADEAAVAAKAASLPGRIAALPEKPAPVLTPAEQTAKIKAEAGAGIQAAKEGGVTVPASEAKGLLEQIKADTASEYNPEVHDAAKGFFKKFESKLPKEDEGQAAATAMMSRMAPVPRAALEKKLAELGPKQEATITVKDLHNLRQELNDVHKHAYRTGYAQEGEVATKAKDAIDEFIVNKMGQGEWPQDMKNYALASTAEEIQNLTHRALYRRTNLSAGQRAAALNTELRQWARPTLKGPNARMKMLRKLSPEAADKMEALATSRDPNSTLLRIIGTGAPTGVMPVALDEIAGHLFTGLLGIHVSPMLLMGAGAAAKHMGGLRVERGIEGIVKTLNDAAAPKIISLQKKLSPTVFQKLMARPRTAQAIRNWAKASGDRKRIAAIALTSAIAKEVNRPDLQKRIHDEIQGIDQENETVVPKTTRDAIGIRG